jgi:hypothetical protein
MVLGILTIPAAQIVCFYNEELAFQMGLLGFLGIGVGFCTFLIGVILWVYNAIRHR